MALCQVHGAASSGCRSRDDNVRDEVESLLARQPHLNLLNIGQLLNSLDLSVSLAEIPAPDERDPDRRFWNTREAWRCWRALNRTVACACWNRSSGLCACRSTDLLPEESDRLRLLLAAAPSRTAKSSASAGAGTAPFLRNRTAGN